MTLPQLLPFSWTTDLGPQSCDAARRILNVVIATLALVLAGIGLLYARAHTMNLALLGRRRSQKLGS